MRDKAAELDGHVFAPCETGHESAPVAENFVAAVFVGADAGNATNMIEHDCEVWKGPGEIRHFR